MKPGDEPNIPPAFSLFWKDYQAETKAMDLRQRGAFVDLLMIQWQNGGLIPYTALVALHANGADWTIYRDLIDRFFIEEADHCFHRDARATFEKCRNAYRAQLRKTDLMNARRKPKPETDQCEFFIDKPSRSLLDQALTKQKTAA